MFSLLRHCYSDFREKNGSLILLKVLFWKLLKMVRMVSDFNIASVGKGPSTLSLQHRFINIYCIDGLQKFDQNYNITVSYLPPEELRRFLPYITPVVFITIQTMKIGFFVSSENNIFLNAEFQYMTFFSHLRRVIFFNFQCNGLLLICDEQHKYQFSKFVTHLNIIPT